MPIPPLRLERGVARFCFSLVILLIIGGGVVTGCDSSPGSEPSQECESPPCEEEEEYEIAPLAPSGYRYEGWQEEAVWRGAAQERIEKHRKDTLSVTVVNGSGDPVEGASVSVKMRKHAFNFGTAVSDRLIEEGKTRYLNTLENNFNYATIETGLKYYNWAGDEDRQQQVHTAVDWLNDNSFAVRGHAAFWEEWWWMKIDESQSASQIHQEMKNKIRGRLNEFEGQMRDWDAENHPFHRSAIRTKVANGTDMTEQEVVAEWWKVANEADQQARMGINEQNVIQRYPGSDFTDRYYNWIQNLTDRGVNIEAIGFMGHANVNRFEGIPRVLDVLDRFGEFGVPLYVSEFHITLEDWANENTTWVGASQAEKDAQAAYLRDFLTAFFSHPAADSFVHWTFWEGLAWRRTSALYGPDWTRRDHLNEYQELVREQWWTDVDGETSGEGGYSVNAFKGEHRVIVEKGDRSSSKSVTLSDGGTSIEITLE